MDKLRWGILGAANIAQKNWKAIYNSGNSVVTAVASRDMERSRDFIRACQSHVPFAAEPRALGRYEELITAPEVDVIYLPLPTKPRKEWVIRTAEAGKHVLCEKPCAATAADLREMLDACRQHRVQFMDGVMFMHSNRLPRLRAAISDAESFGEVRRIAANFSFSGSEEFFRTNIRVNSDLEPLGCLGDLGWYCIRFALWAMNWQMPVRTTGQVLRQASSRADAPPVPVEFSGELTFTGGASAAFYCSFFADEQWAIVTGAKAYLHVADFVLPFTNRELDFELRQSVFKPAACDFDMEPIVRHGAFGEHGGDAAVAQETNMFRNFAEQVRSGHLNEFWPEVALKTQQVLDACLASARERS